MTLITSSRINSVAVDSSNFDMNLITLNDGTMTTFVKLDSSSVVLDSKVDLKLSSISSGTTNSVLIENSGIIKKRTIDDRVWDNSLVDGSGTANYTARWIDSTSIGNGTLYDTGTLVGIGTTDPQYTLHVEGSIYGTSKGGSFSFVKEMAVGLKNLEIGDVVVYTGDLSNTIEIGGGKAAIGKVALNTNAYSDRAWMVVSKNPESDKYSSAGPNETTYGLLLSGTAVCGKIEGIGQVGDKLVATQNGHLKVDNDAPRGTVIAQLIVNVTEPTDENVAVMSYRI